jgi:hypothetical protein
MPTQPRGAGDDACDSPNHAQDIRDQGITLMHVLHRHPTLLTIPELVREITSGSEDFAETDAIERAVRDLTRRLTRRRQSKRRRKGEQGVKVAGGVESARRQDDARTAR